MHRRLLLILGALATGACAGSADPDTSDSDGVSVVPLDASGDDGAGGPSDVPGHLDSSAHDVANDGADSGCEAGACGDASEGPDADVVGGGDASDGADGADTADVQACDGPCPVAVCDPEDFEATCEDGTHVRQCRADGSAVDVLFCGAGAVCTGGECVAEVCVPGEAMCATQADLQTCNALGTGFSDPSPCGPPGVCEAAHCLTPCEQAALERGARGCRFVVPSGHLSVEGSFGTTLKLDGVSQGALPLSGVAAFSAADPSGAHVLTTSAPVQVTLGSSPAFGDVARVLPPTAWGTEHMVLGWANQIAHGPAAIRIVANAVNTQLSIAATAPLQVVSGGDTVIAKLSRGDTLSLAIPLSAQLDLWVDGASDDPTGTTLSASSPIGVFFQHPCAAVPDGVGPCTPLLEQVPPVDRLGTSALAIPLPPRAAPQPDVFRVVAADNDVQFTLDPPVLAPFTLERGAHMSWVAEQPVAVTANRRFALAHLSPGATYAGHGDECDGKGIGGAALTWVPPYVTGSSGAVVRVEEPGPVVLDLAMTSDNEVTIDGVPVATAAAPGGAGRWARVTLTPGTYGLASPAGGWRGVLVEERCDGTWATPLGESMVGVPVAAVAPLTGDTDGDGSVGAADCAPLNPAVHTDALEGCNGVDDDCDGATDETGAAGCLNWFADGDGDGSGALSLSGCACEPPSAVATPFGGDCDDQDPSRGPLLLEICNTVDDDCDGLVDEGCDDDGDGFCSVDAVIATTEGVCANGLGDCVDWSSEINPAAFELFQNQLDDDCDGLVDAISTTLPVSDCSDLNCVGPSHAAVVCALDVCYGPTVVTSLALLAPNGGTVKTMISAQPQLGSPMNGLAPRAGSSTLVLSTGTVDGPTTNVVAGTTFALDPYPTFPFQAYDTARVELGLIVPDAATGFSLDLLFMSSELPENAGKPDVDRLYILLEGSLSTGDQEVVLGRGDCTPALPLAETEDDEGAPACFIGVNSAFVEPCSGGEPPTSLGGTAYACSNSGGSTGWLRLTQPVVGGEILKLSFLLVDVGDALNDSQALIDNVQWHTGEISPSLAPL